MTSAPAHARKSYEEFLRSKVPQAEASGFEPPAPPQTSSYISIIQSNKKPAG